MIFKRASVNDVGLEEIREFLLCNHKRRYKNFLYPDRILGVRDIIHDDMVSHYADQAVESYEPECGASFEVGVLDSVDGIPHVCTISEEGLDIEEIDDGDDGDIDGSMIAVGDGVVWRHKAEHVDSMLKHYNGSFEDADEKEYRENVRLWEEETQSFDIPDVWNHSVGFMSKNNV